MHWEPLHDLIGRAGEPIGIVQMGVRGLVVFVIGLVFVRLAGKRLFGKWDALDIVIAVIIGSNLSRAMTGSAPFGPTLLTTALLIGLHAVLASLAARVPALGRVMKGRAVTLVRDGEIDVQACRRSGVGSRDLEQAFRLAGHVDAATVDAAWLERNGEISVIGKSADPPVRPT